MRKVKALLITTCIVLSLTSIGSVAAFGESGTVGNDVTHYNQPTFEGDNNGTINITFLDVGQGTAIVVYSDNQTMVIDSGDYRDEGKQVINYVDDTLGRDRIDYLVSTHTDSDHIGGHAEIINHFNNLSSNRSGIGGVYRSGLDSTSGTFGDYMSAINQTSTPDNVVREGDTIPMPSAKIQVLNPQSDMTTSSPNDDSVVLHIKDNNRKILLTGDAPKDEESEYINKYPKLTQNIDILKLGHHGANTSTHKLFLQHTNPQSIVISSAFDSSYGHPTNYTLEKIGEYADAQTFWTGLTGTQTFRNYDWGYKANAQYSSITKGWQMGEIEQSPDKPKAVWNTTDMVTIHQYGSMSDDTSKEDSTNEQTTDTETKEDSESQSSGSLIGMPNTDSVGQESKGLLHNFLVIIVLGITAILVYGKTTS